MSIAVIILILVAALMLVLVGVIAKSLRTDDFAEDDVIATYSKDEGMAPGRMVRAGDNFCMVYEDLAGGRYGMGLGTDLDDMELIYNADNAKLLDIQGSDDYILWSEESESGIATKVYYLFNKEIEELCVEQNPSVVVGTVGIHDYWGYFCEEDKESKKVRLVGYNLETGDERTIEAVPMVEGVKKAIVTFDIVHNILNVIEQDLVSEMKLVAVDLNSMVREETSVKLADYDSGSKSLVVDDIIDITPNLMRMTYIIYLRQNGKGIIYEIGDKRNIRCAMVDDQFVPGSLGASQNIAYWIENKVVDGVKQPCLYGFNTASRQMIMNITGVTSYIVDDHNMYYFHEHPQTGKLSLCRRSAAGNIQTINMAEAKREYKEKRKADKEAKRAAKQARKK